MIKDEKDGKERPEAYPKPTETDTQLNNQPEYTEPYASRLDDQPNVSDEIKQAQERMRGSGKKEAE